MLQTDKANEEFVDSWLMNSFVWFCHPYTEFHLPQIMQLKLYWIVLCVLHYIEQSFLRFIFSALDSFFSWNIR